MSGTIKKALLSVLILGGLLVASVSSIASTDVQLADPGDSIRP